MFNSLGKASIRSNHTITLLPPLSSVDPELLTSNSKSTEGIGFDLAFTMGADEHSLYRPLTFNSRSTASIGTATRERKRDGSGKVSMIFIPLSF